MKSNKELSELKIVGTAEKISDSRNLFNLRAEYKSKIFLINSDKKKKTAYFKVY